MVFISNRKLHVSAYSGQSSDFDNFLAMRIIYIIFILCITLTARKLSKPDDDRYSPKHVVFYC